MFLGKGILKICSKYTGEHPCRSAISIKLQSSYTVNALRHERSPANLLHIFRIPYFLRKTPRGCVWRLKKITQEIPEKFRKLWPNKPMLYWWHKYKQLFWYFSKPIVFAVIVRVTTYQQFQDRLTQFDRLHVQSYHRNTRTRCKTYSELTLNFLMLFLNIFDTSF